MKEYNINKKNENLLLCFLKQYLLYFGIFFIISLTLKNIFLAIKLSFIYTNFFIMPFILFTKKIENFIERFLIQNLIGLTYSGIYVMLDVIFKIRLDKITFIIVSFIFFLISIYYYRKFTN